ncbi:hypothetical protein OG738_01685 [Amycolatopsis sp. NBC_01488]
MPAVPPKVMLPSYFTVDPLGSVTSVPDVPCTMLSATTQSFGWKFPPSPSMTLFEPSTVLYATVTRSGRSCSLLVGPLSASSPEPKTIARPPELAT